VRQCSIPARTTCVHIHGAQGGPQRQIVSGEATLARICSNHVGWSVWHTELSGCCKGAEGACKLLGGSDQGGVGLVSGCLKGIYVAYEWGCAGHVGRGEGPLSHAAEGACLGWQEEGVVIHVLTLWTLDEF
jgi:hypothetical protein